MAEQRVQRRLAAIFAADVVGYSRLMREDEAGTLARLKSLREEVFDPKAVEYGGRIVKTTGDGILIEFPSAVDAVEHAIDVQASLRRRNVGTPKDQQIQLRIGINLGDVIMEGDDIYGDGVNVAARLEEMAEPGGVYLSDLVHGSIRNKLDVELVDLGEQSVKNIADPIHVFRLALEEAAPAQTEASATDAIFRRPAVAVLPFQDLSGDPSQEYFSDGLTEDVITALSLSRSFPVIARNSTFVYKGRSVDVRQVGMELGARYVVEGSVRIGGGRVRATAQLINAETGHHVWAERYDRDIEDIFELQDELTQQISARIAPELERAEVRRSEASRARNLDAWECYQRGMSHLGEFTKAGNAEARLMFQKVTELEPQYSQAYVGLAYSHHRDLFIGATDSREESLAQMFGAARKALALDDKDSYAHWMMCVGYTWSKNWALAITHGQRAVELNPSNAIGHIALGSALNFAGRADEGVAHLERGVRLSPSDPRNHIYFSHLADAYLNLGRFEDAAESARKAIAVRADHAEAHVILASALGSLGQTDEARIALGECERLGVDFTDPSAAWRNYRRADDMGDLMNGLRKAGLAV